MAPHTSGSKSQAYAQDIVFGTESAESPGGAGGGGWSGPPTGGLTGTSRFAAVWTSFALRAPPGFEITMLRTRVRAGPVAGLVMSVLFALVLTAVQLGDRYVSAWTPKMGESLGLTLRVPYGPRVIRDRATGRSELRYEHQRIVVPRVGRPERESDV